MKPCSVALCQAGDAAVLRTIERSGRMWAGGSGRKRSIVAVSQKR